MLQEVNQTVFLRVQLAGLDTNRGVRAQVYNSANSTVAGSPFTLSSVANGLYTSNSWTPSVEGDYSVQYQIYTTTGFTVVDTVYGWYEENVEVRSIDQDLATLLTRLTSGRATNLDNLDAAISTRAAAATALSNVQWTNTRATNLDNLDAAVSTRAAAATALSNATWTNTRAGLIDNLDTTVSSRAPSATALSNVQWTNTRAGLQDNLDVAVSTRASQTSVNSIPTNPLLTTDTRLNNLDATISSRAPSSTALSTAQWTNTRATNIDNLDVAVSTRASQTSVNAIPTNPLITTDARLNNLDATISSRAPSSTALSTATWTNARALEIDNLDVAVSTRAPSATALSTTQWTNTRATLQDNLDAAVSTRAPSATALSNATWTNARAAEIDNLDVAVSTRSSQSSVNAIPTNPLLTTDARLNDLDAPISTRSTLTTTQVENTVWNTVLSAHTTSGTAGKALSDAATGSSPSAIADAVWDEALTPHVFADSAAEFLKDAAADVVGNTVCYSQGPTNTVLIGNVC